MNAAEKRSRTHIYYLAAAGLLLGAIVLIVLWLLGEAPAPNGPGDQPETGRAVNQVSAARSATQAADPACQLAVELVGGATNEMGQLSISVARYKRRPDADALSFLPTPLRPAFEVVTSVEGRDLEAERRKRAAQAQERKERLEDAETQTPDGDLRAVFAVEPDQAYHVTVFSPVLGYSERDAVPCVRSRREVVRFDIGAKTGVSGVVRDAKTRAPIEHVHLDQAGHGFRIGAAAVGVDTDAGGQFTLRLEPGAHTIRARKAGYRPKQLEVEVAGDLQVVEVLLDQGGCVSGRIDVPARGSGDLWSVSAMPVLSEEPPDPRRHSAAELLERARAQRQAAADRSTPEAAQAEASGRFTLCGLDEESYRINGHRTVSTELGRLEIMTRAVNVRAGSEDVLLQSGGGDATAFGTVRFKGARPDAFIISGREIKGTFTDPGGRFELPGLAGGRTTFQVFAFGYLPQMVEVELTPGGRTQVDAALEPMGAGFPGLARPPSRQPAKDGSP